MPVLFRRLIDEYYQEIGKITQYSGSHQELSLRRAFANLLNDCCRTKNLLLIEELEYRTTKGTSVKPDGTIKDALRLDWGYWESKDEYDDLDKEIQSKIKKGYPTSNIIFEDSKTAVLIQQGKEVGRCSMNDDDKLDSIIQQFLGYEREEVRDFRSAIGRFKVDLPTVLAALRRLIDRQGKVNPQFQRARDGLVKLCQETINPKITELDIREMLIQHILTEEIFITVFNESQFHRENAVARELQGVADSFFTGKLKKDTLGLIDHYYLTIKAAASNIEDHHEKQKFLKVLYELFYRTYNPKAADRLGIFFTPNEIVDFILKSSDYLAYKHFGRLLSDPEVMILDPAAGTGTFVTELIEHIPLQKLRHKYEKEIFCNEVAILPYYIANLNIEFTYKQKTGSYLPFENICFVDTLDNIGFGYKNKQATLFDFGTDNLERIKRQNEQRISIILGNPPYNANQLNENENNKNREYPAIDKRIRETYVKSSDATKTKVYDMYARFYRWASDRLDKNGIIAFITNRSFIDKLTYDGFRKVMQKEFNAAYIIDTRSDVRANPKISGTTHNVFGIQTGVAVMFLVRGENLQKPCQIHYYSLRDEQKKEEKLSWFQSTKFEDIAFEHVIPGDAGNWSIEKKSDFGSLIPLVGSAKSIFEFYTIGVSTNRDEWVFDFDTSNLEDKMRFFVKEYNREVDRIAAIRQSQNLDYDNLGDVLHYQIKWSSALKDKLWRRIKADFDRTCIIDLNYRPYVQKKYYSDKLLSDRLTTNHYEIFGPSLTDENRVICFSGIGSSKPFGALVSNMIWSLDFIEKTQGAPLYTYKQGRRGENVTDWALESFREHYGDKNIERVDIFHYVYAILNSSGYREKYSSDLKRALPRVPYAKDFWFYARLGESLTNLHLDYHAKTFDLKRIDDMTQLPSGVRLKADKERGRIIIDGRTLLEGIPREAWDYRIGTRSAVEWVLDQYKEWEPTGNVLKRDYHKYRFRDYKEKVINLIGEMVRVSVETDRLLHT
jgi:predicted helicase|nr:type ISP restriction/modification enzyme [Ferrimicrobium acidiphilum]